MAPLLLLLALAFGAADQYAGSLSAHPLGADISGLSAPWLVLPFAVGATQRTVRRAVVLGLGSTLLALCGYTAMTFSPVENAHFTARGLAGFLAGGNFRWFAAGLVTGPLFAWLGYTWRTGRAVLAGLSVAGAICLEPLARHAYGNVIRSSRVAVAEVVVGVTFAVAIAVRFAIQRRHAAPAG